MAPLRGLDYLGGAMYPQVILRNHPRGFAAGFFAVEFGDARPVAEEMLKRGLTRHIRCAGMWAKDHAYNDKILVEAVKQAKRWNSLAINYPARIQFSPACEHQLNENNAKRWRDAIRSAAPNLEYVNTPWTGAILPGEINEVHGFGPQKPKTEYQVSTDGDNLNDIDASLWQDKYSDALVLFGWAPRFNLRQADTTEPPKQRTAKPDAGYILNVARVVMPAGTPPKFWIKVNPFPHNWIYKTDAEDKKNGDDRHNKPVFISTCRTDVIIKASNGKAIGRLKYYGHFAENLHRAYSGHGGIGLYGHEIAQRAQQVSGSEWVCLYDGKRHYGPVHPAFRFPARAR